MSQELTQFDALALGAIKAIGKTLGQMSLYRVGHPAVVATLQEALVSLTEMLAQAEGGEVAYSVDQDKMIANGRIVTTMSLVPNAVVQLFARYKLNSVIFKAGLSDQDLIALCEMAALKPDVAKTTDPKSYLAERGVTRIALNEAIYAKVEKAAPTPLPSDAAAPPPPPQAELRAEDIVEHTLEQNVMALVRAVVKDPKEQERIYKAIIEQIQSELEKKVREATVTLTREKTTLANEQVRTQAVVGNIAEGVVVVDEQGRVLMMNPAAEELYGVKLVAAAGKPLSDFVKEEHHVALAQELATPSDRAIQPEVAVLGAEDSRRTLRAATAVVQNEAGKTVGVVQALSDVTKYKEVQRMEREFVAHVTHELRAPLSSIRAALEILEGQFAGKLSSDESRMFSTALRNSDRLATLINGILDFAKIESGQMTVHPQPSDPVKVASEAAESMRPWCMKKEIQLSLDAAEGLPQVSSDNQRTVQVLVNLLSNAVKFTPKGGRITVRVVPGAGDKERYAVFSVSDTGPGIAKKDHGKIFEKFVQIAAGEKHIGGTGLGLAIAKALINMQNGQMWLESDEGQGATFYFTLPIFVPPKETTPPPEPPGEAPWWKKLFGLK